MATEETATAKKGGIRIAITWMDGESDNDDASRRSSPHRGVPHPSASRQGDGLARSSHVGGGTRIHIDVRLTNPPSSAPKLNCDVFVDARSSPNHGGDVCFASLPPAASKATKGRPDAGKEAEGESSGWRNDALRREAAGMSDGELRREIAGLKAEARKRKGNAKNSRSSTDRGGDVCFASPPPAVAKRKRRREAAAEADVQFFSGKSNDALRRDISEMSDGELQREIAALSTFGVLLGPEQRERHQRLLPLLQKEARRRRQRQGSTTRSRTQDGDDDRNRGARTSTAKPVPFLHF